jgi:hypothetical protein
MVPFSHFMRHTILRVRSATWAPQLQPPAGLRIHMVVVPRAGVVHQTHMPVVMARHLHGTRRHEPQTRTRTAARLPHGTRLRGRLIPTPLMVVGLPLGTHPRGRRIPTLNHHGDQVLGGVMHHLHVQRTLVGRLG